MDGSPLSFSLYDFLGKTSASNLHWEAPRSPSSLLTISDQSRIFAELPLKGFIQMVFPWDCKLQQHDLLGHLRHKNNVWLKGGDSNVAGELACQCSFDRGCLLSSSGEGDCFLGRMELLCPPQSSADDFSDGLMDFIMPPPVLSISKCRTVAAENVL